MCLTLLYLLQEELNMVKKFMCVKDAEDCYALQEAVRFVSFHDIALCALKVSTVKCWSITSINTLHQPSISASVDNKATYRSTAGSQLTNFYQCIWVIGDSADYLTTVQSSVDRVLTMYIVYQSSCWSRTNQDVDQGVSIRSISQWLIVDAVTTCTHDPSYSCTGS